MLISNRWLGCFFRKQSRRICCRFFKHTLHYGQRVFGAGHTVTNRTVILVDLIIITALHIIHCVSLFPSGVTSKLRDGARTGPVLSPKKWTVKFSLPRRSRHCLLSQPGGTMLIEIGPPFENTSDITLGSELNCLRKVFMSSERVLCP